MEVSSDARAGSACCSTWPTQQAARARADVRVAALSRLLALFLLTESDYSYTQSTTEDSNDEETLEAHQTSFPRHVRFVMLIVNPVLVCGYSRVTSTRTREAEF